VKILKFGGSSVANPERIKSVTEIVKKKLSEGIAGVVFSAYSGVTDKLILAANTALNRDKNYTILFEELKTRHFEATEVLLPRNENLKNLTGWLTTQFIELREMLDGVYLLKELTPKTLDYILSFGELLSNYTITEVFRANGIEAEFLDTRKIIKTDNNFNNAAILEKETFFFINDEMKKSAVLRVITGFIGSTLDNETTTLGRGGSDFTAATFGAAINADEIEIWTDVDGVLTADPRKVADSFIVDELSYEEAMELSYFGAKVIYAPTIQPAMNHGIPVRIKNTFNPEYPGSIIRKDPGANGNEITGIASIDTITLIRVEGGGMVGAMGTAGRLFKTLARGKINVILITQASSEHSICVAIEPKLGKSAVKLLSEEFKEELRLGKISSINKEEGLSVIAVVGANMRSRYGVSGRVFDTLGRQKISVNAIAQGSSELNISCVIPAEKLKQAMNALHNEFFFDRRKVWNIYLAGPGNVGSKFLELLSGGEWFNHTVNIKGLINSSKMLFGEDLKENSSRQGGKGLKENSNMQWSKGLQENSNKRASKDLKENSNLQGSKGETGSLSLRELLVSKSDAKVKPASPDTSDFNIRDYLLANGEPAGRDKFLATIINDPEPFKIFVDCSATDDTTFYYAPLLAAGVNIVTANKSANSSETAEYDKIRRSAKRGKSRLLYETNVGAALPVVRVLNDLLSTNDKLLKIEGIMSGSVNFILTRVWEGATFAEALAEARDLGYTEPDPLIDLSGTDVARKLLILVREAGIKCDMSDISVTPLGKRNKTGKPEYLDIDYMVDSAKKEGKKIKFVASFDGKNLEVAPRAVDENDPLFMVDGIKNVFVFYTNRYNQYPLVITGPGAGVELTASGVLDDVLKIISANDG